MCGICGYVGPLAGEFQSPEILDRMLEILYTRGPDEEGRLVLPDAVLGMRRLSVIDLAGGHQPLSNDDGTISIIFNGEIYNHPELRDELKGKGYAFSSQSDTEVVLNAYLEYGTDSFHRLNGMFAIAIWDDRKKQLVLARDRFGQKPLYVSNRKKSLVFASDLRCVLSHPAIEFNMNMTAVANFFRLRNIPGPATIDRHIEQLPPGTCLIWRKEKEIKTFQYWTPEFRIDKCLNLNAAVEEFNSIWPAVVKRHLISDVPVGAFLSGGIDSTLVVDSASQFKKDLKTFSVSFDDSTLDETRHALTVSQITDTDHTIIPFANYGLETLLDEAVNAYDQPFSDPAMFPTLVLSQATRRHVTVALTGDGGDELFGGYQRYYSTLLARRLSHFPAGIRHLVSTGFNSAASLLSAGSGVRKSLAAAARRLTLISRDVSQEYIRQFHSLDERQIEDLLSLRVDNPASKLEGLGGQGLLGDMLLYDLTHWLPDQMLVKVDRASMAYSLETRLPFLDSQLVDLALKIPPELHIGVFSLKRILKKAVPEKYPASLVNRKKQGFQIPIDRWLRQESPLVEAIIETGLNENASFFNTKSVRHLWHQHKTERANFGEQLLSMIVFFYWQHSFTRRGDR